MIGIYDVKTLEHQYLNLFNQVEVHNKFLLWAFLWRVCKNFVSDASLPLHEPPAMWMFISSRYTEEIIPRHPCLKLISNCEQMLSSHTSRRLITMEKVKEFKVSLNSWWYCVKKYLLRSWRVRAIQHLILVSVTLRLLWSQLELL